MPEKKDTEASAGKKIKGKKSLSILKRIRQNRRKKIHNKKIEEKLKSLSKKTRLAIRSGDKEKTGKLLKETCSYFDKAVQTGLVHAKKASRQKSFLMKKASALLSA